MQTVLKCHRKEVELPKQNRRSLLIRSKTLILRVFSIFIIILSSFSFGFGPPRLTQSDTGDTPFYGSQLGYLKRMKMPKLTAPAVIVIDDATGRVVFQRNPNARRAMASTTKMMTAILALEKGKLTDRIVVKAKDLVGESTMALQAGDVVSLEDLLYGVLLPSGNDAATVIADYIGKGSVDRFVEMMNDKAKELGLRDTQFKNPHGLDEAGHFSSAYDLAVLGRYAMRNQVFAKIVGTNTAERRASRGFMMQNSNQFLRKTELLPGVDGIKTGTTEDAGDCIVLSLKRGNHRLIGVVLGSEHRVNDSVELMNFILENFAWYPLKEPLYRQFEDRNGTVRTIGLAELREEMVAKWERFYTGYTVRIDKRDNPFIAGTPVGMALYRLGIAGHTETPLTIREN